MNNVLISYKINYMGESLSINMEHQIGDIDSLEEEISDVVFGLTQKIKEQIQLKIEQELQIKQQQKEL